MLGTMYYNSYSALGVEYSPAAARKWFRKAADAGNADAMLYLGSIYMNGYGAKQDIIKGWDWYAKAAEAGGIEHKIAYVRNCYISGGYVGSNLEKAI